MTLVVPDPVPLDMPPGDADALGEVVSDVAGAGFHLTVLSRRLASPAASAPGWLGADAAATAAQVGVVAALADEVVQAVLTAMHRLSDHADRLRDGRAQVSALRREQDDDFGVAWARLGQFGDFDLVVTTELPEALAVVEELRASEESRRRRHAALLEEIADDAAATGRVLADCCRVVGGRGMPGDTNRVLTYLAARLPGWGDSELAARGRALADALTGPATLAEKEDEASDAMALARSAAFAEALVRGLGEEGMRILFLLLAGTDTGTDSALAGMLVAAFRTAGRSAGEDEVRKVLAATYVPPDDEGTAPDEIALGMAVVLGAAAAGNGGRLPPALVSEWGRQILGREHARGASAVQRVNPSGRNLPEVDPVPAIVELLGVPGAAGAAADLLADRDVWSVLLSRPWDDRGTGLARLVRTAGGGAGPEAGTAMRAGLEALGHGLEDGDPDGWTVERAAAAAVARPLAEGLSVAPSVAAAVLSAGADGEASRRTADMLRGLGYLTIDRGAATLLDGALLDWRADRTAALPAVVPAAYLAVQEYGQRLAHALRAFEAEADAEARKLRWDIAAGMVGLLTQRRLDVVTTAVEPFAARWLDADGAWDIGPDQGLRFSAADAVGAGAGSAEQARAAFERTADILGKLHPPKAPETTLADPAVEAAGDTMLDRAKDAVIDEVKRRLRIK